jgi:tripartite-type tricarboxylate transporter receptor subunit TctC
MNYRKILVIVMWVSAAATLIAAPLALAVEYPSRPITLVVPYSPGGASDVTAKILAERMSEFLGQPVVSTYKPGSGGAIGAAYVAKANKDGYTLLVGSQTPLVISPLVKKELGFTQEDLIPIVGYSKVPISINVRADSKWKTLEDFVKDAKENPGKYSYSSYGTLGASHLAMELFSQKARIKLTHIPFEGSAQANAALLGEHVDLSSTTGTGGLYESGQLRILAIADDVRSPMLQGVPTLTELGYPVALDIHYCFCVAKGTPEDIIKKLIKACDQAIAKYGKEMSETFAKVEQSTAFFSKDQMIAKYANEQKQIKAVLASMGVQPK